MKIKKKRMESLFCSCKKLNKDEQHEFRTKFTGLVKKSGKKLTDREGRIAGKAAINKFLANAKLPYVIKAVNNSKIGFSRRKVYEESVLCH